MAHEFSHILNGDMRLNIQLTSVVVGIEGLHLIGRGMLESLGEIRMTGVVRMPQAGLEGKVTREFLGTARLRQEVDFGRFGSATLTIRGNQARTESSYGPTERLRGTRLAQARQSHPALSFGDWRARFASSDVLRPSPPTQQPHAGVKGATQRRAGVCVSHT